MNESATNPIPGAAPPPVVNRGLRAFVYVAVMFATIVLATLLILRFQAAQSDPWKSPQLLALKEKLVAEPKNEALKDEIRRLDYDFRRRFRRRLGLDTSGALLLLAGGVLAVAGARKIVDLGRQPYCPGASPGGLSTGQEQARARRSVLLTVAGVVCVLGVVSLVVISGLPSAERKVENKEAVPGASAAVKSPTPAELQANWPAFRGWNGSGSSPATNAPLSWDGATGRGILWKAPLSVPGHSSPVVWGSRLFLTGATSEKREVLAFDTATGNLLWRREITGIPGSPARPVEVSETAGFASSTGATDGRNYYAIFANGDLAAVNFEGNIVWSKAFGPLANSFGHASSLALSQGMLLIQLDGGDSAKPASKLVALDAATGVVRWQTSRPVPASWATPLVIEVAGAAQVIALGDPLVASYSLADGRELWRASLLESEIVPSPVFVAGLVIAPSPTSKLFAIRPNGAGDVTKTAVAWSGGEDVPDVTCPAAWDSLVFTVTSSGDLTCVNASDGKKIWGHPLGLDVQASPVVLGGRLLIVSANGVAVQVAAGREFKELSRSALPDRFLASPAFAAGKIFLRGETNLFCLGPQAVPGKGGETNVGH